MLPTKPPNEALEQAQDMALVRIMARRVSSNEQFYRILQSADPVLRPAVYKQLKPYLRFRNVTPFWKLKFVDDLPKITPVPPSGLDSDPLLNA